MAQIFLLLRNLGVICISCFRSQLLLALPVCATSS